MKKIEEIKVNTLRVGQEYTISDDIGKFSKGDKVTILSITPYGDDLKIILNNEKGIKDFFILDKNDDIDLK